MIITQEVFDKVQELKTKKQLQYRFHLRKVYGNMNPTAKEAIFFWAR